MRDQCYHFFLQQERYLGPDGADPPRRDGAEERGREHDAAAEVVLGKVRLASYHNDSELLGGPAGYRERLFAKISGHYVDRRTQIFLRAISPYNLTRRPVQ